jgi:hypothetical protein
MLLVTDTMFKMVATLVSVDTYPLDTNKKHKIQFQPYLAERYQITLNFAIKKINPTIVYQRVTSQQVHALARVPNLKL